MDDLIRREDAISAVKIVHDATWSNFHQHTISPNIMIDSLKELSSAQPEIVRCGECSKMQVDNVFHDCWCSETKKKVWIDHYCGYAERRTDEQVQGL